MPTPTNEEAYAALKAGGLLPNDPDITRLFDLSKADYVERARAEKPHFFAFDARRASPEEVDARLKEIESSLARRHFQAQCDALLVNLREGR